MSKLYQLLIQYLLAPLFKDGANWVYKKLKDWWAKRQLKKKQKKRKEDHIKKAEAYENSDINNADDEFNKLP